MYFSADSGFCLAFLLGVFFLCLQAAEYYFAHFTISDSCFGSSFYMLTGFHGLHVAIGSLLLLGSVYQMRLGRVTCTRHTLVTVSV
jgi:cytochrome c oxidase subunit 3